MSRRRPADRASALVTWWVREYTRGLDPAVAARRVEEVAADLEDHLQHDRAAGASDVRLAGAVLSRAARGALADASWRRRQRRAVATRAGERAPRATRVVDRSSYRRGLAVAVVTALTLVWMAGALGIIGDAGDRADAMYAGVLALGLVGATVARLRPIGMARTLVGMALATLAVGAIALVGGMVPSYNPALEIVGLNGFFATLFTASAWLFWRSGLPRAPVGGDPSA